MIHNKEAEVERKRRRSINQRRKAKRRKMTMGSLNFLAIPRRRKGKEVIAEGTRIEVGIVISKIETMITLIEIEETEIILVTMTTITIGMVTIGLIEMMIVLEVEITGETEEAIIEMIDMMVIKTEETSIEIIKEIDIEEISVVTSRIIKTIEGSVVDLEEVTEDLVEEMIKVALEVEAEVVVAEEEEAEVVEEDLIEITTIEMTEAINKTTMEDSVITMIIETSQASMMLRKYKPLTNIDSVNICVMLF